MNGAHWLHRFTDRSLARPFRCPICKGEGWFAVDHVTVEGGPWYCCGLCFGTGHIGWWQRLRLLVQRNWW